MFFVTYCLKTIRYFINISIIHNSSFIGTQFNTSKTCIARIFDFILCKISLKYEKSLCKTISKIVKKQQL